MLTLRLVVLFVHVTAVIVALGASLFSTFALAPVLAEELEPAARLRVMRRVIRRLGVIVLTALAVLVFTGILNVLFLGAMPALLMVKLALVVVAIGLALYQYGNLGVRIWRLSMDTVTYRRIAVEQDDVLRRPYGREVKPLGIRGNRPDYVSRRSSWFCRSRITRFTLVNGSRNRRESPASGSNGSSNSAASTHNGVSSGSVRFPLS